MKYLAEKLKSLRKENGLSQEELAAYLQISFQSVSKWERGLSYPDVQMALRIARFYKISVDELLDAGGVEHEEMDALLQAWELDNAKGNNIRNTERMKNALKRFPGNYKLMVKLVISLEKCQGTEEEIKCYRREAIEISERIIRHCPDAAIRNEMLYNICYSYWNVGEKELAIERAGQLPGLIKTRENAWITFFEGEEKVKVGQEAVITLVQLIFHQMSGLLYGEHYSVMQKIDLLKRYLKICDILFEKNDVQEIIHCKIGAYMKLAFFYKEIHETEEMEKNLCSVEEMLKESRRCEELSGAKTLLSDAICYKSVMNAEYKKNWVLEQLKQHFMENETDGLKDIYRRIEGI